MYITFATSYWIELKQGLSWYTWISVGSGTTIGIVFMWLKCSRTLLVFNFVYTRPILKDIRTNLSRSLKPSKMGEVGGL